MNRRNGMMRKQGGTFVTEVSTPAIGGRRARGMSLPEVLISLTITAMLLSAVAAAYAASSAAISVNDRFYRASQAARVSMAQILNMVRRCDSCQVGGTYDGVSATVTASNIGIIYTD